MRGGGEAGFGYLTSCSVGYIAYRHVQPTFSYSAYDRYRNDMSEWVFAHKRILARGERVGYQVRIWFDNIVHRMKATRTRK